MQMRKLGFAAVLLLSSAGCLSSYRQPEIRFDGIRLGGLGLSGGTVYAQLHVINPNSFTLRTSELTYDLELAEAGGTDDRWLQLAEGTLSERIEVAGNDSTVVEVPIDFAYRDLGGALRSVLERGTVDYRVSGTVQLVDPVRRSVPYRRTGRFTMAGEP
jgi:LEA14-like dessication related protein